MVDNPKEMQAGDIPKRMKRLPTNTDPAKASLARRLYQEMIKRGWNQSELGRRADLPRDAISSYMTGRAWPTPPSLLKLAKALDVTIDELAPERPERFFEETLPPVRLDYNVEPGRSRIRIDTVLPTEAAMNIVKMVHDASAADGK